MQMRQGKLANKTFILLMDGILAYIPLNLYNNNSKYSL